MFYQVRLNEEMKPTSILKVKEDHVTIMQEWGRSVETVVPFRTDPDPKAEYQIYLESEKPVEGAKVLVHEYLENGGTRIEDVDVSLRVPNSYEE